VLHVVRVVHHFVEAAEVISVQDTGQAATFLRWAQVALLPHLLGDVAPALVIQSRPAHDASDLGHDVGFRLFVLRCESGFVFVHSLFSWLSKPVVNFVVQPLCEIAEGGERVASMP
jgi:hypothetical protein